MACQCGIYRCTQHHSARWCQKKQRRINVTHQWFTFSMITGLKLLSQRYCRACTNEMLSLLRHNPSLHDECGFASRAFLFWLEARMCLSDQTCRAKRTHTGLLLVKQTFQLFTWFTALSVLFLVRRKYDGGFFSSFSRKFFQETLFFRFLTFLLWADVGLTGVLRIPSSPFFYFIWTAVCYFNSYSHLLLATDSSLWAMHQRTQSWNKLNYFLTKKWECASHSLYPGSKLCIIFNFGRVDF